jgi:hypothetical protein
LRGRRHPWRPTFPTESRVPYRGAMEKEPEALTRWVNASAGFGRVGEAPLGGYLVYQAQALGRLDTRLRDLDEKYGSVPEPSAGPAQIDLTLTDYLDLSRLWVLDAYELIRTLDACTRHGLWTPSEEVSKQVKQVKRSLAEVRIPLAKFEPSGLRSGRATPGDLIATPALGQGVGAAWNIGGSTPRFVSRRELSDAVLSLLETADS